MLQKSRGSSLLRAWVPSRTSVSRKKDLPKTEFSDFTTKTEEQSSIALTVAESQVVHLFQNPKRCDDGLEPLLQGFPLTTILPCRIVDPFSW